MPEAPYGFVPERRAELRAELDAKYARLYGLNLSRCLGDRAIKESGLGLSSEPHVSPVLRLRKTKKRARGRWQ